MASRDGVSRVKAGYWFCRPDYLIRPLQDLPIELFTHLYAGFAEVNSNNGAVTIPVKYSEKFQDFIRIVRERSQGRVKTLLSIGGEGSDISPVLINQRSRKKFIDDSISVARNFGFDGLDLCWLYPSSLRDNGLFLQVFLQEWRQATWQDANAGNHQNRLLLTAAVYHHPIIPGGAGLNFNYPCKAISDNLDWINVLAIEFYTPDNSPSLTGPVHAWSNPQEENRCGRSGIEAWIKDGVAAQKLVLGLPFSGYEWNLTNQNADNGLFAQAYPAHKDYKNIHAIVGKRNTDYGTSHVENYVATFSRNERSWIGYDDERCISTKVSAAIGTNHLNLRGCFAWHVGADDETWTLSRAGN
ncbi:class V chitinase-like [Juglans regia]|uniref:Class V chitinase-like n=1 Tax=Juglans regia TaxID=51240 RepID=A0A6P9EJ48_JUGRE|nr:class V chitinase-like [Juglans regia]